MKTFFELLNTPWLNVLGYTLLHSIWQASVIVMIVILVLRFIPAKLSNARYAITTAGMLVVTLLSIATFLYLSSTPKDLMVTHTIPVQPASVESSKYLTNLSFSSSIAMLNAFIQSSIPVFLAAWILGTLLFSLRILTGLWYTQKLRAESVLLKNEWSERIHFLTKELNINTFVTLAESSAIHAPVIIGYIKPIILIPIGMTASLSTAQLETIFLHELMHIRRNDYLINLIQTFIEAFYFFNPFVWMISGIIKREREHCCDDAVVQHRGNAREYVNALATLEEARLSKAGLSLSLAENKNQLLNRIKRLMENSVKNYSSRERIIPALLLVIGLICASWISSQTGRKPIDPTTSDIHTVISDTTKKDKKIKKNQKVTSGVKESAPLQKLETAEADKDTQDLGSEDDYQFSQGPVPFLDFDFNLPPIPDVDVMVPPIPDIGVMLQDFHGPAFSDIDEKDWKAFSKEFEENFKNKFGDFYEKHEKEIEQIMEEVEQKVNSKFDADWETKMQDYAKKQEAWAKTYAENWEKQAEKFSSQFAEQMEKSHEDLKRSEDRHRLHQKEFEKNHQEFEKSVKAFEEKNKRFEEELKSELVKDGYLDENEKLENMHWHNGKIEINGKKIKPEHERKYNELHEKFFNIHGRKFE